MKDSILILLTFLIFSLLTGCEKQQEDPQFPSGDLISSGSYQGEYWPTDKWKTCAPEEVGMNSGYLKELNDEILLLLELHVDIHSIIIVKDGYIVAEQYYSDDYKVDSLHFIASCTKSITSALFGIASDQGYDLDLSRRMIDYFPEYEIKNLTEDKKSITLEHMLTMSDGLEWYELEYSYDDERNTFRQWINNGGGIEFVLNRPTITPPGSTYSYNTGVSHVLSGILQKVTGTRTDSFAMENLFTPLGIDQYYWPVDDGGINYGGSSMQLTPRDMARFSYLYLRNGVWDGSQIVPADWVEASHQPYIKRKYIPDYYYGYHWWVGDDHTYSAVGYGGQWITIIPEHDLVVVFTNRFADDNVFQRDTPARLLHTYILPAVN